MTSRVATPRNGRVLAPVRRPFRAVGETVVPEAADLDREGWERLERIVEDALEDRPREMRRQLALLLRVVEWMPVLRYGRRLSSLDRKRRARVLEGVQNAPLLLLRRGFWGLRSLVFMGYYGRPEARREIGYDARLRGRREKGPIAPGGPS